MKKVFPWSLLGMAALLIMVQWIVGAWQRDYLIENLTYVGSMTASEVVLTDGEKRVKYQTLYAKIVATYGVANTNRAMPKRQAAEFVALLYRIETLLRLPPATLISIAVLESSIDPRCVGGIGELGIFQLHRTAIPPVHYYLKQLYSVSPEIAKELDPQILRHDDVVSPLVAARAAGVLLWGLQREYSDPVYWISAYHWGSHRVDSWYKARTGPRDHFTFLSGPMNRIDKRSPLQYYFFFERLRSNFSAFNLDMGKVVDEYKAYERDCSANERVYIKSRELIAKAVRLSQDTDDKLREATAAASEIKAHEARYRALDTELRKVYGETNKGKQDYKTLFARTKRIIKEAIK